jgi:DNA-binding NarL/FixJ family response regulator
VQISTDQPATSDLAALTRREHEVLRELARGRSYSAMATALFVSENTVKTHVTAVYRKLGVDRRIDALRVAREHRLL